MPVSNCVPARAERLTEILATVAELSPERAKEIRPLVKKSYWPNGLDQEEVATAVELKTGHMVALTGCAIGFSSVIIAPSA